MGFGETIDHIVLLLHIADHIMSIIMQKKESLITHTHTHIHTHTHAHTHTYTSHLLWLFVHSWPLRAVIKVEQYVLTAARLREGETQYQSERE